MKTFEAGTSGWEGFPVPAGPGSSDPPPSPRYLLYASTLAKSLPGNRAGILDGTHLYRVFILGGCIYSRYAYISDPTVCIVCITGLLLSAIFHRCTLLPLSFFFSLSFFGHPREARTRDAEAYVANIGIPTVSP